MRDLLLVLPLLIPLSTAVIGLLFWSRPHLQRALATVGAGLLLASGLGLLVSVRHGGIHTVQVGAWPAPFGITLAADLFSAIMVVLTGLIGLAAVLYSLGSMDAHRERFGYYPLVHILLLGVCGAFLTGDIFNLYVWFEVMLISSFVLMALGGERAQLEGAIKYVTLNLMSSALFLAAVGVLYGIAGTLNMADLSKTLRATPRPDLVLAPAMLLLVAFGIKAAIFPLFFWLPASYHTPPVAVSALFAGLLTKVGVYAMIRVFTLLFDHHAHSAHLIILVASGLTMVTGVLGAVAQNELRRILSFHIISQIGYMIMGLGLFTPISLAGSIFYIAHHIIVKTNLFLISGLVFQLQGSYQLKRLGGLYRKHPGLAALFLTPALSLAGMPPLSGFWAKLILVKAGLELQQYLIVAVSLMVSLLTLFSMLKIWNEAFWKAAPAEHSASLSRGTQLALFLPVLGLAAITLWIGLMPEPLFSLSEQAAQQLVDPTEYIRRTLGE
ncbi:Na+/H+ antiporter subunit D [Thermoflexus sp.]|uniref:Na+/H+ antiporter subunit D n=1 Tax=Thermoflexus sp. TaxID=1969742 RepID=UPI0025EFD34C|nr:Na+/H+ antiporter subunit D [Thermoflexus sp.]MDW8179545.1 Na+/H+ antiporter subunit D [Anaerolineae bacterium]MCS6962801.1 Na+/H+ antiporter subunit D [Thermoflexus sp.]MCS7350096.1 Na+/H+ antiporter subunit D [Thermoflexus sp.]MCX7689460.1 Na+/H+ antiporter subunit D [Thermoflexus sp.]MDW8184723.1 Na+/H+ antiporter subunit D [Anaerolineae bacterium]